MAFDMNQRAFLMRRSAEGLSACGVLKHYFHMVKLTLKHWTCMCLFSPPGCKCLKNQVRAAMGSLPGEPTWYNSPSSPAYASPLPPRSSLSSPIGKRRFSGAQSVLADREVSQGSATHPPSPFT